MSLSRPLLRLLPVRPRPYPATSYVVGVQHPIPNEEQRTWVIYTHSHDVFAFRGSQYSPEDPSRHRDDLWALVNAIRMAFATNQYTTLLIYTNSQYCDDIFNLGIHKWQSAGLIQGSTWTEEADNIDPNMDCIVAILKETERGVVQVRYTAELPPEILNACQNAAEWAADQIPEDGEPALGTPAYEEASNNKTHPQEASIGETFDDETYADEAFAFDVSDMVSNLPDVQDPVSEEDPDVDMTSDQAMHDGTSHEEPPATDGAVNQQAVGNEHRAAIDGAFLVTQMFRPAPGVGSIDTDTADLDPIFDAAANMLNTVHKARYA